MLDNAIRAQLRTHLEKLQRPIEIVASCDDSAKSRELLGLLQAVAALSPLIALRSDGTAARRPAFSIGQPGQAHRVHFAGIPLGHEFTSLVLALLQAGGHPPRITQELASRIATLPGGRYESFVSLSCHNCPDVVQAFNVLALLNPDIEHVMIDGALFPDEVAHRQVMAVPTVLRDGMAFGQGRMSLEEIVARLDTDFASRQVQELDAREPYDVLVVGGGPAGAAAAIYAARKGLRTGVLAERFGGQVLDTLGIENFVSVQSTEGPQFAAALERHVGDYDVDLLRLQQAVRLVPGEMHRIRLASGAELKARTVIVSTGARWREMNVPGEREYRGKGVAYCPHCDGPLFKGKRVAVVGGGNSGVEAAIDLAGIAASVTLLEFDGRLRADAVLQERLGSLRNVRIITSAQTTEVTGSGGKVDGLAWRDRITGKAQRIELDGIFVQIGLLPNTDWLKGTLALSARGEIDIDTRGETSVPGVFAAGDCTTVPYKQIIIATGAGATAALSAFDHLIRLPAPSGGMAKVSVPEPVDA